MSIKRKVQKRKTMQKRKVQKRKSMKYKGGDINTCPHCGQKTYNCDWAAQTLKICVCTNCGATDYPTYTPGDPQKAIGYKAPQTQTQPKGWW